MCRSPWRRRHLRPQNKEGHVFFAQTSLVPRYTPQPKEKACVKQRAIEVVSNPAPFTRNVVIVSFSVHVFPNIRSFVCFIRYCQIVLSCFLLTNPHIWQIGARPDISLWRVVIKQPQSAPMEAAQGGSKSTWATSKTDFFTFGIRRRFRTPGATMSGRQ